MTSQPPTTTIDPHSGDGLEPDPSLPPTAVPDHELTRESRWTWPKILLWTAVALLGGVAWAMIALVRGETVNAIWFVFAAVCSYLIGYRFYSKVIQRYITRPDDRRATPGRGQGRRQGLHAHRPSGALRPPLRRDRRRRPARRARARSADGLPSGHDLDHRRRHPRRCRAGLPGALLLDAPRRTHARADGP